MILFTSTYLKMVQDRATLTMIDQCDISNGPILSDLERSLTPISRSRHYLTLNISETVRDTMEYSYGRTHALLKGVISNELE